MFDWPAFLTQNNIEFVSAGRYHVTAGNIAICCPLCPNDTTFNLHISLSGRGWHCFRTDSHKSLTPQRLIQAILKCPRSYADSLVAGSEVALPGDRDFMSRLSALFEPIREEPMNTPARLHLPKSFRRIEPVGSSRMFYPYLERRGFKSDHVHDLFQRYDIRVVADGGQWHGRIIFPITMNKRLVTWTGRHIGGSPIRYLTLSIHDPETPALQTIKETVLWYDQLKTASGTLVVCEGPFDALKVNYLGADRGVHATCLFGKSITDSQREHLEALDRFERKIVLLDRGMVDHLNPRGRFAVLEGAGFELVFLPQNVKDPGEFTRETFDLVFRD
jgi:hypothetical protein